MAKLIQRLLFILFFPLSSLAGGWSSGGGDAVICGLGNQNTSARLLDLFEGETLKSYSYNRINTPVLDQAIQAASRLNGVSLIGDLSKLVTQISKQLKFLPADVNLTPVNDAGNIILPNNCKLSQVARFDSSGDLFVDQGIWEMLPATDQAALLIHEALYWQLRLFGAQDSKIVRQTVAALFSEKELLSPTADLPKTAEHCHTGLGENGIPRAEFFIYKDQLTSVVKAQFIIFNSMPALSLSTADLFSNGQLLNETDQEIFFFSELKSEILQGELIHIKVTPGLKNQTGLLGFGPPNRLPDIPFTCD